MNYMFGSRATVRAEASTIEALLGGLPFGVVWVVAQEGDSFTLSVGEQQELGNFDYDLGVACGSFWLAEDMREHFERVLRPRCAEVVAAGAALGLDLSALEGEPRMFLYREARDGELEGCVLVGFATRKRAVLGQSRVKEGLRAEGLSVATYGDLGSDMCALVGRCVGRIGAGERIRDLDDFGPALKAIREAQRRFLAGAGAKLQPQWMHPDEELKAFLGHSEVRPPEGPVAEVAPSAEPLDDTPHARLVWGCGVRACGARGARDELDRAELDALRVAAAGLGVEVAWQGSVPGVSRADCFVGALVSRAESELSTEGGLDEDDVELLAGESVGEGALEAARATFKAASAALKKRLLAVGLELDGRAALWLVVTAPDASLSARVDGASGVLARASSGGAAKKLTKPDSATTLRCWS